MREKYDRFHHLARLGWDLHDLGIHVAIVIPVTGRPVLEIQSGKGGIARVTVIRRYRGWAFTWRPWWARLWRRDKGVVAHADNAADIIAAEVNA